MPSVAEVGAALAAQLKPLPVDISRMTTANPEWLEKIQRVYRSQVAHAFILHGNLNDYQDDSGLRTELTTTLSCAFDTAQQHENDKQQGKPLSHSPTGRRSVFATYTPTRGFEFAQKKSAEAWEKVMTTGYDADIKKGDTPISAYWEQYQLNARGMRPMTINETLALLNLWFQLSYRIKELNIERQQQQLDPMTELVLTVAFSDADLYWPAASGPTHRDAIGYLRDWARNLKIGQRNRIFLFARHVSDIDSSLTTNDSGVYPILIKRPDKDQRRTFLANYNKSLEERMQDGTPLKINQKAVARIPLEEGMDYNIFAVNSAGMSRKQLEYTIMSALVDDQPVTLARVKQIKQDSVKAEFGGLVDFTEPTHGFEVVGGHEGIKRYFTRACQKLKTGDSKSCPRGVMLLGPPGTAKTQIALAAAKESGMNFLKVDLGKLFGGVVGESLHANEEAYFCDSNGRRVQRFTMKEAYEAYHAGTILPYTYSYTDNGGFRRQRLLGVIRHDRQEDFYKVKTKRGREVIVTEGHSVFTRQHRSYKACTDRGPESSGWLKETPVNELQPGMEIAITGGLLAPSKPNDKVWARFGMAHVSTNVATLGGLWVANGCYNNGRLRISAHRDHREVTALCESFGCCTLYEPEGNGLEHHYQRSGCRVLDAGDRIRTENQQLRKACARMVMVAFQREGRSFLAGLFLGGRGVFGPCCRSLLGF